MRYEILARGLDGAQIESEDGVLHSFGHPFEKIWDESWNVLSDEKLILTIFGPDATLVEELRIVEASDDASQIHYIM